MRFTWNSEKNRKNVRKHGIAFDDAIKIFDGQTFESIDDRFDYGEIRVYAIGLMNDVEVTVIYADRGDDECHIISAWKAEPYEKRTYWQNYEED